MLLDALEENLMHAGQADVMREAVDGLRQRPAVAESRTNPSPHRPTDHQVTPASPARRSTALSQTTRSVDDG
jgi:hypothetical protein